MKYYIYFKKLKYIDKICCQLLETNFSFKICKVSDSF